MAKNPSRDGQVKVEPEGAVVATAVVTRPVVVVIAATVVFVTVGVVGVVTESVKGIRRISIR